MICRDAKRGEAARAEIAAATSNPAVELLLADCSLEVLLYVSLEPAARGFLSMGVRRTCGGLGPSSSPAAEGGLTFSSAMRVSF